MTTRDDTHTDATPLDPGTELQARIRELGDLVAARAKATRTKRNLVLGLGATLAVTVIVCLSALTRMGRALDAPAIAQIGRIELQQQLPGGREAVAAYLEREAPRLVGSALTGLVDMVPRMRELLVNDLTHRLDRINSEFEDKIVARMEVSIRDSKTKVDAAWPDATGAEKLEKLVATVARDFTTSVRAATAELYPAYSAEMLRVVHYLEDLNRPDPAELTAEQAQRREIVQTLLQLIARAKENG